MATVFRIVNAIFASVILLQSIVWAVLSLLAILCTNEIIKIDLHTPDGVPNLFTRWLYMLYLSDVSAKSSNFLSLPTDSRVVPNDFFIYIFWAFFLFSLFLAFTSIVHLVHAVKDVKRNKLNASAIALVVMTFLSCVYDLAAAIVFVIDYFSIRNFLKTVHLSLDMEYLLSIPLIMATLAAKGYVLWIFNFAMAVCISVMLNKMKPTPEPDEHVFSRTNSAYDAFGDSVLSNGIEEAQNVRRPTQFTRKQTTPYAPTDEDGRSTRTSWAEMPPCPIYLQPFDSIPPHSASRFAPSEPWFGSTPNLNMVEPEPDYSPEPTRRWNQPAAMSADNIYATR